MIIRKAKESDFEDYYRIWHQMELEHQRNYFKGVKKEILSLNKKIVKPKMKKSFLKIIKKRNGRLFIAEDKKRVLGFLETGYKVSTRPAMKLNKIKEGYIYDLAVEKNFRRKGIASLLKKQADKWFKEKKIKYIYLRYDPANKNAIKVYKKWGFIEDQVTAVTKI